MELGSNFGMDLSQIKYQEENVQRYLADENVLFYDSGRSAIKALISIIRKGKILLPSYLCKSVVSCFQDFRIDYYLVNEQFEINIESLESKLDKTVFYKKQRCYAVSSKGSKNFITLLLRIPHTAF